jgi:hypothetical protein
MDHDRRIVLKRLLLGPLIVPSLLGTGCGSPEQTGNQAPKAGLDELEAQNKFYLERQKSEASKK